MAKAYWISFYQQIRDSDKLMAYAKLAGPAIEAGGGQFLARGMPARTYESGLQERVTLIVFESLDAAVATHKSADYQKALAVLGDGVVRDLRIVSAT